MNRGLISAGLALGVCPLLCLLPAQAASEKPLGAVVQAHAARLGHETAAVGTTVYPGDSFATDTGGILRLRLGSSEMSLLSHSAAVVSQGASAAHVKIGEGTVEFSSPAPGALEIETPVALVRAAAGQAALGDVTLTGPKSMIVSAVHGALVVERAGETRTIEEGKAYNVSLEPSQPLAPAAAAAAQGPEGSGISHSHHGQLIFNSVLVGGAAAVAYCLWSTTESPSGFCH
ncbi:MAG TPA: hypothetical protein VN661_03465 [Candidatus Acidoferrales bacterium]|nr:hypothetical protein [Candidatus Acidoferrales bacterium]